MVVMDMAPQPDHLCLKPLPLPVMLIWTSYLTSLRLSFLNYKKKIIIVWASLIVVCLNYTDQHPNDWYIWFLLLIFLVSLLCGVVLFCLQCWLKRSRMDSPRRTMAVFAVGDLDSICGTEAAVSPTLGIHLQTQNLEQYPVPCFDTLGPPPPYEEIPKTQGCF
ncbi:transmembrane protein 207 isoform X3 [Marmota marmota marmota]|uniref:transmembrane protein 207 isoform X3 n=1 Tax=Marmota marmota marmota TaxID=9994 RepID=UPI002093BB42|nr:transmembrane protein 207 isoform X3 [Marmota marmota marmota]